MKKIVTTVIVLILIACCCAGFFAYEKMKEDRFNSEYISETELFDTKGNEAAIIYDFSLQSEHGLRSGDHIYLPIGWVNDYINDKFFFDKDSGRLIYTLPDEILYFDIRQEQSAQNPRFISKNDTVYLSAEFTAAHSGISYQEFTQNEAARIYISDDWEPYQTAKLNKDTVSRTGESTLQRCIHEIAEGECVRIVKKFDSGWSRILTEDGWPGYVETDCLGDEETVTPVNSFAPPVYEHKLMTEEVILAWHQVTNMSANNAAAETFDSMKNVNVISPTWFSVTDNEGHISSLVSDTYIEEAHNRGLQVWALVDNFSTEISTTKLLSSLESRITLIDGLVQETTSHGIDGINVDFEQLEEACGPYFAEFIRELSVSCRNNGLVLSVDNPNMQTFNIFYDRRAQAECADYVINMGYDEHYSGGEAGSVASIPFVQEGIELSLNEVPARQLINGIPFYTRLWLVSDTTTSSNALGLGAAQEWVNSNHVQLQWHEDIGQYYGHFGDEYMWLEDMESLSLKIDLARSNHLGGIACWKLGLEVPEVWDLF